MRGNLFDRVEAELGGRVREGAHLDEEAGAGRLDLVAPLRHGMSLAGLAMMLAASLVGEFPASAGGHALSSVVHLL
ncbi:MAG: hypothetical protein ACRDKL_00165 [Solirubrobacteraceae bacterium]